VVKFTTKLNPEIALRSLAGFLSGSPHLGEEGGRRSAAGWWLAAGARLAAGAPFWQRGSGNSSGVDCGAVLPHFWLGNSGVDFFRWCNF
jgi:hypothetical protein